MNLVYFEAHGKEVEELQRHLSDIAVVASDKPLHEAVEIARDADLVSVFVASQVQRDELNLLPRLKFIATRSAGYDHIDVAMCQRRGIVVSNVPTYGENTVAEHAFALILALSRKIFQSYERTEKMDFDREGLEGFDLKGKTLGVVGCGAIGKHAVKIGRGFDMRVVIYDIKPDEAYAQAMGAQLVKSLDELLSQSDVITLHVPYIAGKTHHLINKDNIKNVKPGAILVNTARGSVVDTEALLWALQKKTLAGAGLDVLEEENDTFEDVALLSEGFSHDYNIATLLRNHILAARDDVIITPHNAFNSREAKHNILMTTIANIRAYVDGQPVHVVS